MATNFKHEGNALTLLNSTGATIASSSPIVFGLFCMAIALADILNGVTGSVAVEGVFTLTKTTGAIKQGGKVWWDATNGYCINAPAKNAYFIGYAETAAGSSDTTVDVILEDFCCEGTRVLTLAATGNETLTAADFMSSELVLFVPNTAAKTLALPSVADIPIGATLFVKKTTADAFAVTLDPASSEQIAGGSTFATIDANNDLAKFVNNGTAWILMHSTIA